METRQLRAEATEKCGCRLSQQNLQLSPLHHYSVFNLLVTVLRCCICQEEQDEVFLWHCAALALCSKGFYCVDYSVLRLWLHFVKDFSFCH